ncbi:hypothetical protein GX411_07700 [Candidatus Fermentibacteria bacterium]|nr:hypothetical protein [Candidatus Fermentibacteria bacterium]
MADTKGGQGDFYPDARPWTRWWWFSGEIREEDVRSQLKWLRDNGFGGAEIAWVYPQPWGRPGPRWLSREWTAIVAKAKAVACEYGLGLDYTFGTLWPFGGSFVEEADSAMDFDGPIGKRLERSWEEPYAPPGRILNHLDRAALERYASRMGQALAPAMEGRPSGLFCDSWEVPSERLWTRGFGERFRERFGYPIEPHMNELDSVPDARFDYRRLLADMIVEEFYEPFTRIARRLGGFSRVQAHGSPTALLAAYATADVPETEAILFDPPFATVAASAAALSGGTIVSSESFTCMYGWKPWPGPGRFQGREQAADIKLLGDALMANGVNHIVWHGMPFNPRGGSARFYASIHVGYDSAFRDEQQGLNAYFESVCTQMRRGVSRFDLAVLLPLEDNWMRGALPAELRKPSAEHYWELQHLALPDGLEGFRPFWISAPFLRECSFEEGLLRCGHASARALLVDVEWLEAGTLASVLELARRGLPVCVRRKPAQPGRMRSESFEKDFAALVSLPNVSNILSRIFPGRSLIEGRDIPEYWCRSDSSRTLFFFANPLSRSLKYHMKLGQSHQRDIVKTTIHANVYGRQVELRLAFNRYDSLLVSIDRAGGVEIDNLGYSPPDPVVEGHES